MSLPLPEHSSRNRSASMGDSGLPKHEHKRPRLSETYDSEETTIPTPMVTNDIIKDKSLLVQSHIAPASLQDDEVPAFVSPPQSPLPQPDATDMVSPQSKVTINTRPISSQSSVTYPQPEIPPHVAESPETKLLTEMNVKTLLPSYPTEPNQPISISSSECGSPIIQVAVPEDLDQDPIDTQWEPLPPSAAKLKTAIQPGHVQRTFPYFASYSKTSISNFIQHVSKILLDGSKVTDSEICSKVMAWVIDFAENASPARLDIFEEDAEFWTRFPLIISSLLKRKTIRPGTISADDTINLTVAYAQITKMIVDADEQRLNTDLILLDNKQPVQVLCLGYLQTLNWILVAASVPLYQAVTTSASASQLNIQEALQDRLLESYTRGYMGSLFRILQTMAPLFTKQPALVDASLVICANAGTFFNAVADRAQTKSTDQSQKDLSTVLSDSMAFLRYLDMLIDQAIVKQQSWLNIETCDKVFKTVASFFGFCASKDTKFACELMDASGVPTSLFSKSDLARLGGHAWKFVALLKCLKKGRMETRVASVQIMASDLVDSFNDSLRSGPHELCHCLLRYLTWFIRENDVIRYIIGVDSHPQIIERSANILGFLCVSRSFCNDDTDIIWQTILDSQDPRSVVALLGAFQHNLDNLEVENLRYMISKLSSLSFDRLDGPILDFLPKLIDIASHRGHSELPHPESAAELDDNIIKFCITMMREACTSEHACGEFSARTRGQMQQILGLKLSHWITKMMDEVDIEVLGDIFEDLCNDLRNHTRLATGSAFVLGTILSVANDKACAQIVPQLQELDVPCLIVRGLVELCKRDVVLGQMDVHRVQLECFLQALGTIIRYNAYTIPDLLIETMWMDILSNSKLDQHSRSMIWTVLADVFHQCRVRNHALDRIVEHHLPHLPAELLNPSVMYFARQSVKYESFHAPIELMEPQDVIAIPGIERVWQIMLTAPSNGVEIEAMDFITEQYLDNANVARSDFSSMEATHFALIDRCTQQIFDAASHLKADSDLEMKDLQQASEDKSVQLDHQDLFLRFHRSLLFLKRFLNRLKTKPGYISQPIDSLREILKPFEKKGQELEITLQVMGHRAVSNNQVKWTLGLSNTGAEVWQFLSEITGWTKFTMLNGGKRLNLKDDQNNLQDLGVKTGSLIVNKIQGSPETTPARIARPSSPVDQKIMHHFDALYNLLELEDQFAKEVFDFLRMFSPQAEVVQRVRSMTVSPTDLLPVEKPFKLMYYAKALTSCIEEESYSSEPNTSFLKYGIDTILSVLPNLTKLRVDRITCLSISHGFVEALVLGFKAKVPIEVSSSYIKERSQFCEEMLRLWNQALQVGFDEFGAAPPTSLVKLPFEVMIEAFLHDENLWDLLSLADFKSCLRRSFLHESRDIRQTLLDVIHQLTGVVNPKSTSKSNETRGPRSRFPLERLDVCTGHMWDPFTDLIQIADEASSRCEELFDALQCIFRSYSVKMDKEQIQNYIERWKTMLLAHKHLQRVGSAPHDFFIASLGKLLLQAFKAVQVTSSLHVDKAFIQNLFSKFLFPPLGDVLSFDADMDSAVSQQSEPILDMQVRRVLYDVIIMQSSTEGSIEIVCEELSNDLLPRDFGFQPTPNNDRQSLRSETGYAGLRNLSNTCYLNSLISQLFMNVEFRDLVMNVNIIDRSKQKLVAELGKVFAYMQNSYEEAVNPEPAIEAITLWDGDQIDVTVQMDVDEFFNLLFDRLESQIIDPKVCNTFKEMYGGQLVQQIKSKECDHVSERLEAFSAVQVEIKGKATLEESLRAYVEGEVLQGENKYSCTGCGRHVDAVKRACLKTLPNHLIFNLKRFDYDIMSGTRCKVNDEFGFPPIIDMSPYTLAALTEPENTGDTDMFELVGVIIHSGTAESGHYYSYIRQRPSHVSIHDSWIQFNDHDVTFFDPTSIKDCCFGGIDFGAVQCPKFYNGYMLFYQRSASIRDFEQRYTSTKMLTPVHLPLTGSLHTDIAQHNELYLRSYVAQDAVHARFMRSLLQQKATSDHLSCTTGHSETSSRLILQTLDYLDQFSTRWKELPEVEESLTLLRNYGTECEICAQTIIGWLIMDDNLVDNLYRSCYAAVRRGFANVILACWYTWSVATRNTTQHRPNLESAPSTRHYIDTMRKFLEIMAESWDLLQRHGRAWDSVFLVIQSLLRNGQREARLVIEAGFLELVLEIIHVHVISMGVPKRLRLKYSTYLLQRERNRPFNHAPLIQLLLELLQNVNLATSMGQYEDRFIFRDRTSTSSSEAALLGLTGQNRELKWLQKVIFGRQNPRVADLLVAYLCHCKQLDGMLCSILKDGLAERDLTHATACLAPTLTFISHCSNEAIVIDIVEESLMLIETTNGQHGKDFLVFVQEVIAAGNDQIPFVENSLVPTVKKLIPRWSPVLLMAPNDLSTDVRSATSELLLEILFSEMDSLRETDNRRWRQDVTVCRHLAKACATYAENNFINDGIPLLHPGQASQASSVVNHCLQYFADSASDEEEAARITSVFEALRGSAEGAVETATDADWNANSDLEAMSEVDNMSDTSN